MRYGGSTRRMRSQLSQINKRSSAPKADGHDDSREESTDWEDLGQMPGAATTMFLAYVPD